MNMKRYGLEKQFSAAALSDHKETVFSICFYICGLFFGAFLCKTVAPSVIQKLLTLFSGEAGDFKALLLHRLILNFLIFIPVVFSGLSVIGFMIIDAVPFLCGAALGLKTAYYYINNGVKGLGYAVIMILPTAAFLITIVILACGICRKMSRNIYDLSVKRNDTSTLEGKPMYLKKLSLSAIMLVVCALADATVNMLFLPLISFD